MYELKIWNSVSFNVSFRCVMRRGLKKILISKMDSQKNFLSENGNLLLVRYSE